ncbi:UDP-glycosyltransferase 73C2 [Acorus gramineus]|uniref:Glycosyltransferase n=1 Tax=Acorus gramineus TaxID=55184 RepID=A0AAV9BVX7_ACOGR|nr:UDP-glycosyltransferase 73C2 [Acorus gramineus]
MEVPNHENADLHFVFFPFMAQGHMLPMLDIAALLSLRGATVTFITTPFNAARLRPSLPVHSSISLVALPFPSSASTGLPDGCETVDALPSRNLVRAFFAATKALLAPSLRHLRDHLPPPSCVITDVFLPWTREVAREFGAPRLIFSGSSCFAALCVRNLRAHGVLARVASESERFVVPGLPHRVELTKVQEIIDAAVTSDGVIFNSFEELEREYMNLYRETTGKRIWAIGPVSLSDKDMSNTINRGRKASIEEHQCIEWLEQREPKSVIYVSFGSIGRLNPPQTAELARALDASGRNFMWVVKSGGGDDDGLPEEFKVEPVTARRMIVRGWAPQVAVLSHGAVGGFVTHCGWNSVLEGLCTGVPMVTWPLFAEQFVNEKAVVDVLRVGVRVGVERANGWAGEALEEVMDGGTEGGLRRERARELGERARRAVEGGGTSFVDLTRLIEFVSEHKSMKGAREI